MASPLLPVWPFPCVSGLAFPMHFRIFIFTRVSALWHDVCLFLTQNYPCGESVLKCSFQKYKRKLDLKLKPKHFAVQVLGIILSKVLQNHALMNKSSIHLLRVSMYSGICHVFPFLTLICNIFLSCLNALHLARDYCIQYGRCHVFPVLSLTYGFRQDWAA